MAHLKIAHLAIEEASTEEDQDVEMAHLEDDRSSRALPI